MSNPVSHKDNFNLLRLVACLLVTYSHSFPILLGVSAPEPLSEMGMSLGTLGVLIFFTISGALVTNSFIRTRSTLDYLVSRVMRIFPAAIVLTLVTAYIIGPLVTTYPLDKFYTSKYTREFVMKFIMLDVNTMLPFVFETVPYKGGINGSYWTLIWEFKCYLVLMVVGTVLKLKQRKWTLLVVFVVPLVMFFMTWSKLTLFFVLFFFGGCLYQWKRALYKSVIPLTLCLSVCVYGFYFQVQYEWIIFPLAYVVVWAGNSTMKYGAIFNRVDISYGLYLYSFPVGQLIMFYSPPDNVLELFGLTVLFAGVLAYFSYILVEKPALQKKKMVSEYLVLCWSNSWLSKFISTRGGFSA